MDRSGRSGVVSWNGGLFLSVCVYRTRSVDVEWSADQEMVVQKLVG